MYFAGSVLYVTIKEDCLNEKIYMNVFVFTYAHTDT